MSLRICTNGTLTLTSRGWGRSWQKEAKYSMMKPWLRSLSACEWFAIKGALCVVRAWTKDRSTTAVESRRAWYSMHARMQLLMIEISYRASLRHTWKTLHAAWTMPWNSKDCKAVILTPWTMVTCDTLWWKRPLLLQCAWRPSPQSRTATWEPGGLWATFVWSETL